MKTIIRVFDDLKSPIRVDASIDKGDQHWPIVLSFNDDIKIFLNLHSAQKLQSILWAATFDLEIAKEV